MSLRQNPFGLLKSYVLILFIISLLSFLQVSADDGTVTLTEIGEVDIPGILFDVDIENNYAYLSEYSANRFHIIDITEPSNPIEVGNFTVNLPHYFEVSDSIAYISAWTNGVQIFNVSNPADPFKISEFRPGIVGALTVDNNFLFVGSEDGINILDISNPNSPQNLSFFQTGGNSHDFFVANNLLYTLAWNWTTETSWVKIIDYSTPEQLTEEGCFDLGSVCYDIHVIGDYIYLASSTYGIKIVDFSIKEDPQFVLSHDLVGEAFSLEVKDDILYLGNGYSGLHIFDVSNLTSPVELANMNTGGSAEELEIRDNLIYLSVDNVGLLVIRIDGLTTTEEGNGFTIFWILFVFCFVGLRKKLRLSIG